MGICRNFEEFKEDYKKNINENTETVGTSKQLEKAMEKFRDANVAYNKAKEKFVSTPKEKVAERDKIKNELVSLKRKLDTAEHEMERIMHAEDSDAAELFDEIDESAKENISESDVNQQDALKKLEKALPKLEDLIKSKLGFKPNLKVSSNGKRFKITSDNIVSELGKTLVKTLFTKINIDFWGGEFTKEGDSIWFNPKISYEHPSGGSNGTDFIWDSLWYKLEEDEWVPGRSMI